MSTASEITAAPFARLAPSPQASSSSLFLAPMARSSQKLEPQGNPRRFTGSGRNAYETGAAMTKDRIEQRVECFFDALDRCLMMGALTQAQYDTQAAEISAWAVEQYKRTPGAGEQRYTHPQPAHSPAARPLHDRRGDASYAWTQAGSSVHAADGADGSPPMPAFAFELPVLLEWVSGTRPAPQLFRARPASQFLGQLDGLVKPHFEQPFILLIRWRRSPSARYAVEFSASSAWCPI